MKIALFALFLISTAQGELSHTQLPVVKVISSLCENKNKEVKGSGLIIKYEGNYFVVTTEHGIVQPNISGCNKVFFQDKTSMPASLVIADWANGLALLSLGSNTEIEKSVAVVNWSSNQTFTPLTETAPVRLVGFPSGSSTPLDDKNGVVDNLISDRGVYPAFNSMIEVGHTNGQSGMSGSPVFNLEGSEWVGILSSHALIPLPQDESKAVNLDHDLNEIVNQVFMVSREQTHSFLNKVLIQKNTTPMIQRVSSSFSAEERVIHHGLEFAILHPMTASKLIDSRNQSLALAGGDPVGITGPESNFGGASVLVKNSKLELKTEDFITAKQWLKNLPVELVSQKEIEITSLVEINSKENQILSHHFLSLYQFFTQIKNNDAFPLYSKQSAHNKSANSIKASDLASVKSIIQKLKLNNDCKENNCAEFLIQVQTYVDLIEQFDTDLVTQPMIDHLLDNKNNNAWAFMWGHKDAQGLFDMYDDATALWSKLASESVRGKLRKF